MDKQELNKILEQHQLWLDDEGGKQANLRGADLRGANLRDANLRDADLRDAELRDAELRGADLRGADLRDAELRGADLWGAELRGADLRGADLWGATGNLYHIKSLQLETYPIAYTAEYLQIGCERHPIDEWWGFDLQRIEEMDGDDSVKFWEKYKNYIKKTIELSPAKPTGAEGNE